MQSCTNGCIILKKEGYFYKIIVAEKSVLDIFDFVRNGQHFYSTRLFTYVLRLKQQWFSVLYTYGYI